MIAALALCVIVTVTDGDSMKLRCADRKALVAVRLSGIDAPEVHHTGFVKWPDQPYGQAAATHLRSVCPVASSVQLTRRGIDRYGRTLGAVRCGAVDASESQAQAGLAWSLDPVRGSRIPALVAAAKTAHTGLWTDPAPINPATWRKNHGGTA